MFPLLKTPGGKYYLKKNYYPLIKPHAIWMEPFCGGLNLTFNKPSVEREICSDLNDHLINVYKVLQRDELEIGDVEYGREVFDWAADYLTEEYDKLRAIKYVIRNRMSRDADMRTFVDSQRLRGGQPENRNAWQELIRRLPEYIDRVSYIEFYSMDALELIRAYRSDSSVCMFLDPPYLHATRNSKKLYGFYECDNHFHAELLHAIVNAKAQVILCGYPSDLYNMKLPKYFYKEVSTKVQMGTGAKANRIEAIWYNR